LSSRFAMSPLAPTSCAALRQTDRTPHPSLWGGPATEEDPHRITGAARLGAPASPCFSVLGDGPGATGHTHQPIEEFLDGAVLPPILGNLDLLPYRGKKSPPASLLVRCTQTGVSAPQSDRLSHIGFLPARETLRSRILSCWSSLWRRFFSAESHPFLP
jgi:hypothetical protein